MPDVQLPDTYEWLDRCVERCRQYLSPEGELAPTPHELADIEKSVGHDCDWKHVSKREIIPGSPLAVETQADTGAKLLASAEKYFRELAQARAQVRDWLMQGRVLTFTLTDAGDIRPVEPGVWMTDEFFHALSHRAIIIGNPVRGRSSVFVQRASLSLSLDASAMSSSAAWSLLKDPRYFQPKPSGGPISDLVDQGRTEAVLNEVEKTLISFDAKVVALARRRMSPFGEITPLASSIASGGN